MKGCVTPFTFSVDRSIFDLKNHNKMDAENCLVCLDILYEPHFALPCQHLFCKLCFRQIESLEIVCPYCRQSIKKWEYNRDKANQIQELHPKICQEKLVEEKKQKLLKKPDYGETSFLLPIMLLYNSFTDMMITTVILVLFWMFSVPLVYLIYFVILIGIHVLVMGVALVFLCWRDLTGTHDNLMT